MNRWPGRLRLSVADRAHSRRRALCIAATLVISFSLLPLWTRAQGAFTDYTDVQHVLDFLADILPPELKSADPATRQKAWPEWLVRHDRDIRTRLVRGDEDTIANWLLFGTSFTRQPKAVFDGSTTAEVLRRTIAQRTRDLISLLASADANERAVFSRQLLLSQGYGFDSVEEQAKLERHLYVEVDRVVAERQQYMLREDAGQTGDVSAQILAQSNLFHDRGLSLDTSILASFGIEQALAAMKAEGLLPPNGIRRVAVIGPGLDFADKNSGHDFYPVQTMQPFTSIDSLTRLGVLPRPEEIELTTFDISPRVNDHIRGLGTSGKAEASYVLRLARPPNAQWTPALNSYWESAGDRIGTTTPIQTPPDAEQGIALRAIAVKPQIASRITPVDFNVVTEKWTGRPFDLVLATNVFVYYDRLDQALAFAGIEAMLRTGGFFITNNVVVEPPSSRLRSVGLTTVHHSADKLDHVFWYRREAPIDQAR
jgi:hypothetical protein